MAGRAASETLAPGSNSEKDPVLNRLSCKDHDEKSDSQSMETLARIALPQLHFPKSMYAGWEPPSPRFDESEALDILLQECAASSQMRYADTDFINLQLQDFTIYHRS